MRDFDLGQSFMRNRHGYVKTYGAISVVRISKITEAKQLVELLEKNPRYKVLGYQSSMGYTKVYYQKKE